MNTRFSKQQTLYVLIVLLLPLFFINIRDSHDWGGDFAQYLSQAENIAEGRPHQQTNYIYLEENSMLGPPAYPVGYPILLSPVVSFFGIDFEVLMIWQTFFLFLFALISFLLFAGRLGNLLSLLLVLVMVYNPWMLRFKTEIVSDIPFSLFLLGCVYLYTVLKKDKWWQALLLGALVAFMIMIRSMGFVFLLALVLYALCDLYKITVRKQPESRKRLAFNTLLVAYVVIFTLISRLVFDSMGSVFGAYISSFSLLDFSRDILHNLSYYSLIFRNFFYPAGGVWEFGSVLLASFMIVFTLLGMIIRMVRKFSFPDLIVLVYLLVIMVYPYRGSGFRFLLPLLPFFVLYAVEGIVHFKSGFRISNQKLLSLVGVLVLFLYLEGILRIISEQDKHIEGPLKPEAQEVWDYIRENTPEDCTLAFFKPRVLGLFADRKSLRAPSETGPAQLDDYYKRYGVAYLLVIDPYSPINQRNYIKHYQDSLKVVFENPRFRLYRRGDR